MPALIDLNSLFVFARMFAMKTLPLRIIIQVLNSLVVSFEFCPLPGRVPPWVIVRRKIMKDFFWGCFGGLCLLFILQINFRIMFNLNIFHNMEQNPYQHQAKQLFLSKGSGLTFWVNLLK